ncbi:MAG TPA: ABC transporter ATP-binding protein [Gaiellaceae bacterium]|nr:ABC transporter ATP-binding protein [Gaiellaceae bacterium]
MPLVRLEGVTKAYPGVVANDDVTLELRAGEIHALLGENGAGKTTLMGTLYGLHRPDAGSIIVDGREAGIHSPRDALALGIGYVQQHFSLIPTLTVAENVVLALRGSDSKLSVRGGNARVRELAATYELDVDPTARVEDLSVGQQQRAELLKALARETRILLLDEPSAVLTPQESEGLGVVLRRLAENGVGIFLVSHKFSEVLGISDRISVLRRGRLVGTLDAASASRATLAEMMVGELRAVEARPVPAAHHDASPRLEVSDLWVAAERGGFAVKGVGFTVNPGEVLGVAGVEGNGQVELTEALAGVRRPAGGTIRVDGQPLGGRSPRRTRRLGITHIPADRHQSGLVASMSVEDNLVLPVADQSPYSVGRVLRRGAIRKLARRLISEFDIRVPGSGVLAGALSGGNQQKLILARELSRRPSVIIACYPTRGLDFGATEAVQQAILDHRDEGAAIVYVSVDLDELLSLSDRIIVLHHGALQGEVSAAVATPEQLGLLMGGAAAA